MFRHDNKEIFAFRDAAALWGDIESSVLNEVDHLKLEGKTRQQIEEMIMGSERYAEIREDSLFVILDEALDQAFGERF
jgi:hypothetical protein